MQRRALQVAAPKALCCTQGCIMAVVAVASMLNLCCAGILLNDGSAACAWQVNRLKADFARALEPPHTLHAADCKAWHSADLDPDELLSFSKPQWMDFVLRSAAVPLVQADQMRGSGGPTACGRPTSFYLKNACGGRQELGTCAGCMTRNMVGMSPRGG